MKNKNIVIIVILVILLLGSLGYISYDKLFTKEVVKNEETKVDNEVKEEKIDINSRLVQNLYNKVTTGHNSKDEADCPVNYMYYGYNEDGNFYADKATEEQKMYILGTLLSESRKMVYKGDVSLIPKNIDNYTSMNTIDKYQYYYTKDYIESLYKDLYGKDAVLDTSAYIKISNYSVFRYYYVAATDKYMLYMIEGGGSCGGEVYTTITNALKSDKELKIYEKEIDITMNKESKYVYTFKLEDDGMYSFYSRVKEG